MKTYTLEELKQEFLSPEGLKKYEKKLNKFFQSFKRKMDKKFILLVDIEATRLDAKNTTHYVLQEIEYDHPNCIVAADPESAVDYCTEVLRIDPRFIG